ncbi:MAG: hypothetical protein IKU86_05880 [Thermoguttaceae bacterium]|nr:hypothetical protein [Thermoguttaceae bacterium]
MKFFSRVETKINETKDGGDAPRRWKSTLVVALAALSCVGCVGRKQYAINEAILISERRQLEDEIYRLQFELRDALEENERLRQERGGAASVPASRTRAGIGATDAFFPGLDASQTQTRTTGGVRKVEATAATADVAPRTTAPVLRTDAETAPSIQGEVETLPDYVPIPLSSTRNAASVQGLRTARTSKTDSRRLYATASTAPQAAEKTFGVRREVGATSIPTASESAAIRVAPVAASTTGTAKSRSVVSSVFVDSPQEKSQTAKTAEPRSDGAAWSPLAR